MTAERTLELLIRVLWILAASFFAAGTACLAALILMHIRNRRK